MIVPALAALLLAASAPRPPSPSRCLEDLSAYTRTLDRALARLRPARHAGAIEEALRAYRRWDFPEAVRILERNPSLARGRHAGAYGYLYGRSLGYTGRYEEAYRFLHDALDSHPAEMYLWDAFYIANRNLPSPRYTTEEFLQELPRRGGSESYRQFLIGRALTYDALESGSVNSNRARIGEAARALIRSIQIDPAGSGIELDAYPYLFSSLYYLGKPAWCEATAHSILLRDTGLLSRHPIDLDLSFLPPESRIRLLPRLADHPSFVLSEIEAFANAGPSDTGPRAAALIERGERAAADARIAGFPRLRYRLLYKAAYLHLARNEVDSALADYETIRAESPDYAEINLNLSMIQSHRGDYTRAAESLLRHILSNFRGRARNSQNISTLLNTLRRSDLLGPLPPETLGRLRIYLRDPAWERDPSLAPLRAELYRLLGRYPE